MLNVENKKLEDISYKMILLATGLIGIGILAGSFVNSTVYLAVLGSFVLFIGIILYMFSQFSKGKTEHHQATQ